MESKRNVSVARAGARLLVACLLLLVACLPALAAPDYKQLKQEIEALQKAVNTAAEESAAADKALSDNRAAQSKAAGNELARLKREARTLADTAGKKADALSEAQQKLADKQGELRNTAASHAVAQLTARGAIEDRVGEANNALADWKAALGTLPGVPRLRAMDGIVDPDERAAIRRQDKKMLDAYDKWAGTEDGRIDREIKQAQQLVDGEAKFKDSLDGGKMVVEAARAMKQTLEARKKSLSALRKTAQDRIAEIK